MRTKALVLADDGRTGDAGVKGKPFISVSFFILKGADKMFFPEIDAEETKKNVHVLLSIYRRLARIADEGHLPKVTASYSFDMPVDHGGAVQDKMADNFSRKEIAESEIHRIVKAMNKLNAFQRKLLYDRYMQKQEYSDIMLYMESGMSERTYYRELNKALLLFAEAYENGRLLAEKRQEDGR